MNNIKILKKLKNFIQLFNLNNSNIIKKLYIFILNITNFYLYKL